MNLLLMASFAYNNEELASTGHSSFFLNYGYHPLQDISLNATDQSPTARKYLKKCYGLTSARLCWVAIGWHGVGRRLWDTGQGLKMDCV